MAIKITRWCLLALAAAGTLALDTACSGHSSAGAEDGTVDAGALESSAMTNTAAPGVHVTRTDGRSVAEAATYQLTERRFASYLAAAERLAALEQQDSIVRDYLDVDVSDAGSTDAEAGRAWLEANEKARRAITGAGLTVHEYYVASIAVGQAERFLRAPRSAPRTPALLKNARLLRAHASDVARLRELREERASAQP